MNKHFFRCVTNYARKGNSLHRTRWVCHDPSVSGGHTRRRLRTARLAAGCGLLLSLGAARQTAFLPVDSAIASSELTARALFFPLDASFAECVPLRAPCPATSSSLLLVPAAGRTVAWSPEGTDLPRVVIDGVEVRPVGVAPPEPDLGTYLVPTLTGDGIEVRFLAARLDGDRLAAGAGDATAGDTLVPKLEGPELSTSAPSSRVPETIVSAPRVVDAADLRDSVPALLVRRAAPSRVVVGVAPSTEWNMSARFVRLLDEGVVARAARNEVDVGIAVPLTDETTPGSGQEVGDEDVADDDSQESSSAGVDSEPDEDGNENGKNSGLTAAVSAALGAALAGVFLERRRRRRRRSV